MSFEPIQPLALPRDHPAFAGHFPGRPIVPGVVLLDLALVALTHALGRAGQNVEIKSAKFLSPVTPGEALTLHHAVTPGGARFEIRAGERLVASGVLAWMDVAP
jgi:3-hydroxymyristoyl/3-hydroxydecanoyl-(acyl carrier protein) dehydratase